MKKRFLSMLLAVAMVAGLLPQIAITAKAAGGTKTSVDAVAEMTWGANLADLYMADIQPPEGATNGYDDFTAKSEFGLAAWFWDESFEWLCYHDAYSGTFSVEVPIPAFASASPREGDLFKLGVMVRSGEQMISVTLSDSKIVKSDSTVIPLDSMNRTYMGTPHYGPDINDWYTYNIFAPEETPEEGADLNGAKFCTTVTVNEDVASSVSKAEYYFELYRTAFDQQEITDIFLNEGANVFRLPVSWTWFVDDRTFAIDEEWLAAVRTEVDYILSQGAYCILDLHNDYMSRSFVATKNPDTGEWENFHWTNKWMEEQYSEYVNARYAAIWSQIAAYFKDYSDHLIFETCNEPAMEWTPDVDYDPWMAGQEQRVNELNEIFVNTVRAAGGNNDTRILCLAVAEYNIHTHLDAITIPEDSDYLMIQIHSYDEMERTSNGESWTKATDDLFEDVAAFQTRCPKVPVIVGEVGLSHSWENMNDREAAAEKVAYFFQKAEALGVPCLWWEDYFPVTEEGRNHTYWLYDKTEKQWGRPELLEVIQEATHTRAALCPFG